MQIVTCGFSVSQWCPIIHASVLQFYRSSPDRGADIDRYAWSSKASFWGCRCGWLWTIRTWWIQEIDQGKAEHSWKQGTCKINTGFISTSVSSSLFNPYIMLTFSITGLPNQCFVWEDWLVVRRVHQLGWILYLYAAGICRKGGLLSQSQRGTLTMPSPGRLACIPSSDYSPSQVAFHLPAKIKNMPHREPVLRITNTQDGMFMACSQDGMMTFWSNNMEMKRTKSVVVGP